MKRFDRNIRLFGLEGQRRLAQTKIVIVGLGGVGSIVNQECALLGVGDISHIEPDCFSSTSRNRLIGFNADDPLMGLPKTEIARRVVQAIDPSIQVKSIRNVLESAEGIAAIVEADWVFACMDRDGSRFVLNEICMAYKKSYADLATDVPEDGVYGGRVFVSWLGRSCLYCKQLLDLGDVRRQLTNAEDLKLQDEVYGVSTKFLNETGPSVVSLNGIIASLGVTEFMVAATGLRRPVQLQTYRADLARLTKDDTLPPLECPYCTGLWGIGDGAHTQRYIKSAA